MQLHVFSHLKIVTKIVILPKRLLLFSTEEKNLSQMDLEQRKHR